MTRSAGQRGWFWLVLLALAMPTVLAQEAETVFSKHAPAVEVATENALRFLADSQRSDGTFPGSYGKSTGIVSLVGMAMLSKGYTPGKGEFGQTIDRCIEYVIGHSKPNGLLDAGDGGHGPMYSHNISTLFLSEVSGMVDRRTQARLAKVLGSATRLLLAAQAVRKSERHRGGWRYHPTSNDSDLSCSGWALMALRSARLNGASFSDKAIEDAVDYVYRNRQEQIGHFGYQDAYQHRDTLTGAAILSLELCGHHGTEVTRKAGDYVLKNFRALPSLDFAYYGNYYNAQAMFQLGGKYWRIYADWMYPQYLKEQKGDGSWRGSNYGEVYSTAIMALAFTVPYRQLPIYQRDERVGE